MDVVNIRGTHSVAAGQEHERKPQGTGQRATVASRGASAPSHQDSSPRDKVTLSPEAMKIKELAARDREVRTHEQAHAATGGAFAGSPSYSYQQGPDGKRYAVGGEVPIDVTPVSGDPAATLEKAQAVRSAALAPERPSAQDQSVAAKAAQMATKAKAEIIAEKTEEGDGPSPGPGVAAAEEPPPSSPTGASEGEDPPPRRFNAVA